MDINLHPPARWINDFIPIDANCPVDSNNKSDDYVDGHLTCTCQPHDQNDSICMDDRCINFAMQIECVKCKPQCKNNRIRKRQNANISVFEAGSKGYGLKIHENLPAGSFISEYLGEIVSSKELERRMSTTLNEKHLYVMQLKHGVFLDGRRKSSICRYINHSCEPNCSVTVWNVENKLRAGIFTIKDVTADEELTFDYQWSSSSRQPTKCFCGTSSCRGFLEVLTDVEVQQHRRQRLGVFRSAQEAVDTDGNFQKLDWFLQKRVRVWWEGNQSFFEADVIGITDSGKVRVRYLTDEEESEEYLTQHGGTLWEWLDETMQLKTIKRKNRSSTSPEKSETEIAHETSTSTSSTVTAVGNKTGNGVIDSSSTSDNTTISGNISGNGIVGRYSDSKRVTTPSVNTSTTSITTPVVILNHPISRPQQQFKQPQPHPQPQPQQHMTMKYNTYNNNNNTNYNNNNNHFSSSNSPIYNNNSSNRFHSQRSHSLTVSIDVIERLLANRMQGTIDNQLFHSDRKNVWDYTCTDILKRFYNVYAYYEIIDENGGNNNNNNNELEKVQEKVHLKNELFQVCKLSYSGDQLSVDKLTQTLKNISEKIKFERIKFLQSLQCPAITQNWCTISTISTISSCAGVLPTSSSHHTITTNNNSINTSSISTHKAPPPPPPSYPLGCLPRHDDYLMLLKQPSSSLLSSSLMTSSLEYMRCMVATESNNWDCADSARGSFRPRHQKALLSVVYSQVFSRSISSSSSDSSTVIKTYLPNTQNKEFHILKQLKFDIFVPDILAMIQTQLIGHLNNNNTPSKSTASTSHDSIDIEVSVEDITEGVCYICCLLSLKSPQLWNTLPTDCNGKR
eukprot:gene4195-8340_t